MATTSNGFQSSSLSSLPAELGNYIYELALRQPEPIRVRWRYDTVHQPELLASTSANGHTAALLTTCKTIQQECSQLLYAYNTFLFDSREPHLLKSRMAGNFLDQISRVDKLATRSIAIHVGPSHSMTTPSFTLALDEIVQLAKHQPHIKFEARVNIRMSRHTQQLAVQISDIAASYHSLALKKEADMQERAEGKVLQRDRETLQEMKGARKIWLAKAKVAESTKAESTKAESTMAKTTGSNSA